VKKLDKPSTASNSVTIDANNIETIFVDKIINVGVSFNVSRLTLTQEVADGTDKAFANLVIPTSRLFEFIKFMSENIIKNDTLKQELLKSLDVFKNELITSEEKTDN